MQKNAQPTKLVLRAALLASGISLFLLFAYLFFSNPKEPNLDSVEKKDAVPASIPPPSVAQAPLPIVPEKDPIPSCLKDWNLPGMPKSLNQMRDIFWERIGPPDQETLQWRNIHFSEHDGTKRRLRVSLEASGEGRARYEMRLFSVDDEDLPVPMQMMDRERFSPSRDIIQRYLKGNDISYDASKTLYEYADGSQLDVEQENGKIKLFHFRGKAFSLGCEPDAKGEISCQCLR